MGYIGMGDVASSGFNSTKYPGICKPSTDAVRQTFRRMQTQLNRVAAAKSIPTTAIDGDIGPGTLSIFGKLQPDLITHATKNMDLAAAAKIGTTVPSSCSSVASIADVIANVADSLASELKAPSSPPAPKPIAPPMLVMPDGTEKTPSKVADIIGTFQSASPVTQMAGIGIVGGILYFAFMRKRTKRGRR